MISSTVASFACFPWKYRSAIISSRPLTRTWGVIDEVQYMPTNGRRFRDSPVSSAVFFVLYQLLFVLRLAIFFHPVLNYSEAAYIIFGIGLLLSLATYLVRDEVEKTDVRKSAKNLIAVHGGRAYHSGRACACTFCLL
jgi:hypothetical protein